MGKCADCKNCKKDGVLILLTRYAVAPANAMAPNANADIWATLQEETGWMNPTSQPPAMLRRVFGDINLGQSAHYTRRLLRTGFVYVFDEKRNTWYAWFITDQSNCIPFNPKIFDQEFNPDDESDPKTYCEPKLDAPILGAISIPGNASDVGVLWIAFSDTKWTKEVFNRHKYAVYRSRHMRKFDFKRWMGGSHPHAKKIDELSFSVAEFAPNGYRGAIDFHFSATPFNYRRHKISSEVAAGTSVVPWGSDVDSSDFKKISGTRQDYKNFLIRPPVTPTGETRELYDLLKNNHVSVENFDIRYLGVGHPEKAVQLEPEAIKAIPCIRQNSEAVIKEQIEVFKNRSPHCAIFTLDDPVGITSDLACLSHIREESYLIDRLKDKQYRHKAMSNAAILQIKDTIKNLTLNKIEEGQPVNRKGNERVYIHEEAHGTLLKHDYDPLYEAILESLRYPKNPDEQKATLEQEWQPYLDKYDETARIEFESKESLEKKAFEDKYVTPIHDAYFLWLDSYRTTWYMECNYDEKDLQSGVSYSNVVSAMVADMQAREKGIDRISVAVTSPEVWSSTNYMLRAMALNQSELMELWEYAQENLAEFDEDKLINELQRVDNKTLRLRVMVKVDDYKFNGPLNTLADYKTAMAVIAEKAKNDREGPEWINELGAWFAKWSTTIQATSNVIANAKNPNFPALLQNAKDSLDKILVQLNAGLHRALAQKLATGGSEFRRLCTFVGALHETPVARLSITGTSEQSAKSALRFINNALKAGGEPDKLPKGQGRKILSRTFKDAFKKTVKDPEAKAAARAELSKLTTEEKKMILRFVNDLDIPEDLRNTMRIITGSDYFLLDDANKPQKFSTLAIFRIDELKDFDDKAKANLKSALEIVDNKGSHTPNKIAWAEKTIKEYARTLAESPYANDSNVKAFTYLIEGNGNVSVEEQMAKIRGAAENLHEALERMALQHEDVVAGRYAILGHMVNSVAIGASLQMIFNGNGRPFEGHTKLIGGFAGSVGILYERTADKMVAKLPTGKVGNMISKIHGGPLQEGMLRTVGRKLGAFGGGVFAVWDVVSSVQQFLKGNSVLGSLYFLSGAAGFGASYFFFAFGGGPVMWACIVIGALLAVLIARVSPDVFATWLDKSYFGKGKDEKFKSFDEEFSEYRKLFNPQPEKAEPEKYLPFLPPVGTVFPTRPVIINA